MINTVLYIVLRLHMTVNSDMFSYRFMFSSQIVSFETVLACALSLIVDKIGSVANKLNVLHL